MKRQFIVYREDYEGFFHPVRRFDTLQAAKEHRDARILLAKKGDTFFIKKELWDLVE